MVRRILHFTIRKLWLALAILLVLAAVTLSLVRYSLPYLDNYRDQIEQMITDYYGQDVIIGNLSADWSAFGPSIVLQDVELLTDDHQPFTLQIDRTHLVLNLWQSLWQRQWLLDDFVLEGVRVDYTLDLSGPRSTEMLALDGLEQLLLDQLENFRVVNSRVRVDDGSGELRHLLIEQLRWTNAGNRRHGTGRFRISEVSPNSFNFVLDTQGSSFLDMSGELFVEADALDFSSWVETVIAGVDITRAEVNVRAWFDFEAGRLGNGQIHFGHNQLGWQRDGQPHALITSPVTWAIWPQADGWMMSSEALQITIDDVSWPVDSIRWQYADNQHTINLHQFEFRETSPLWSLFGSPGAQIRDWLSGIQPAGVINDVQIRLTEQLEWLFYVRGEQLHWQAHQGVPGMQGLSFELWSSLQSGSFRLQGNEVSLVSPHTFHQEQQLSQINWSGYWGRLENGWHLGVPDGSLRAAGVDFSQQFALSRYDQQSPMVEWWLEGDNAELHVADALQLLPLQIGEALTDYLFNAIEQGAVDQLSMLWRGELETFPYYDHDGVFHARILASDLDFRFQPDWPAIEQTQLNLAFRDHNLYMNATGGSLGDAELISVEAVIPALVQPQPWLHVEAEVRGSGDAAYDVFMQSPLASSVGASLAQISSGEVVDGDFTLRIPLFEQTDDDDFPVEVDGGVTFSGQDVYLTPLDLTFTNTRGRLLFSNDTLDSRDLHTEVFGLPVALQLEAAPVGDAYQLDMQVDGQWDAEQFARSTGLDWTASVFDGQVSTDADFRLQLYADHFLYDWQMRSDLSALGIMLPEPFSYPTGAQEEFELVVRGDEQALNVFAIWPDQLRFEGDLVLGESSFSRALLEFGATPLRGPAMAAEGLVVHLDLEQVDAAPWMALSARLHDTAGNTEHAGLPWSLPALKQLNGRIGILDVAGQRFHDLRLNGEPAEDAGNWRLDMFADEGRLTLTLPDEQNEAVRIHADFLNLQAFNRENESEPDSESNDHIWQRPGGEFFDTLPAMYITCDVCRYDDSEVGRLEIRLDTEPGRQLQLLHLRRNGAEVSLTGGWQAIDDEYRTHVAGWVAIADVGNLIADFGSQSVVRDSTAQIELSLNWAGSPAQFALHNLNGELDWRLGSGYLRDVSDGGARLLSIFSLESLMRKLTLDFRDIFARGMFYSSFRGTLSVEDGVVHTDNTRMNGAAGDMEVSGSTNLVTEELNYNLVYVPKVTSSLPVLVAWMVNPPTGIAALLLDRMLHDAQVISRLQYQIRGTLSEPEVNEVARDQTEIELPDTEFWESAEENDGSG